MEKTNTPIFTEEELKILGFTKEDEEALLDAEAIARTADLLPEEADEILDRIDAEFPDDIHGAFEKFAELSKKDPEFITKLVAMNELFADVKEEAQKK